MISDDDRIAVYETLAEAREQFGEDYGAQVLQLTRARPASAR
jgi:hypothetical protein